MTDEHFLKGIKYIEKLTADLTAKLIAEYVAENAEFSKGDIITDSSGSIEIESVSGARYKQSYSVPVIFYHGKVLTKKLTARKDGHKTRVYQGSVIKVIKSHSQQDY